MEAQTNPIKGTQKAQLRARVEAKKKELEADLARMKVESQAASGEARQHIEQRLAELKRELSDGWDNLSEQAAARLNRWLAK